LMHFSSVFHSSGRDPVSPRIKSATSYPPIFLFRR
jgi:hypothetical protein